MSDHPVPLPTSAPGADRGASCVHDSVTYKLGNITNSPTGYGESPYGSVIRPSLLFSNEITLHGETFDVRQINGERRVLRKGRQRHCWHSAAPALAAAILRGVDVECVR